MPHKIAIIDLGTNTFHLLIAEGDERGFHIIVRDRLAVKIGAGGINDGYITESGIQRALVAMQSYKNTLVQHGVEKVYAFGTSALRNARNAEEVVSRILDLTGIHINIISGDLEAEYIYYGVKAALGLGEDVSLIMDIGGGSVEFIIGDNHQVFWKRSFEVGAQRLLEKFQKHDPITAEEIQELEQYLSAQLEPLFEAMHQFNPTVLVGSSGTFDTLSDIFCVKHDVHKSPEETETPLTIQGFHEIFEEILFKTRKQRMSIPGMIEMRVDMIVVACIMIDFLLKNFPFRRIRVSTYSLKEGVLANMASEKIGEVIQ